MAVLPKISEEAMSEFNAINRGVYIADNLNFLRSLNDECIDLVCIDPPFAKNETFTGDKLKPPLTAEEKGTELRLMKRWGIVDAESAVEADIVWPFVPRGGGTETYGLGRMMSMRNGCKA